MCRGTALLQHFSSSFHFPSSPPLLSPPPLRSSPPLSPRPHTRTLPFFSPENNFSANASAIADGKGGNGRRSAPHAAARLCPMTRSHNSRPTADTSIWDDAGDDDFVSRVRCSRPNAGLFFSGPYHLALTRGFPPKPPGTKCNSVDHWRRRQRQRGPLFQLGLCCREWRAGAERQRPCG